MVASTLNINALDTAQQLTITVRVRGLRSFRVRAWLTAMVLRVAGWVSPVPVEVEMAEEQTGELAPDVDFVHLRKADSHTALGALRLPIIATPMVPIHRQTLGAIVYHLTEAHNAALGPKRDGNWIIIPEGMTLAEAEARLAVVEGAESGCVASATHPKPGGGSKVGA